MFKLLLLFATMASASASEFLVTEYYSDNTCTDVFWFKYAAFKKMGCYYKTATTSEKLTKVEGGYNLTSYTSATDCTGAAGAPQFNSKPASCEKLMDTVWTKNVWKTSFPTTAAEIAKGEVAQITYQNVAGQTCGTVCAGNVMKLGACANLSDVGHKHVFNSSDASHLVVAKYTGDATCANAISGYNNLGGVDSTTCTALGPPLFQKIIVGTKESAPENNGSSQHFAYLFVATALMASIVLV